MSGHSKLQGQYPESGRTRRGATVIPCQVPLKVFLSYSTWGHVKVIGNMTLLTFIRLFFLVITVFINHLGKNEIEFLTFLLNTLNCLARSTQEIPALGRLLPLSFSICKMDIAHIS